MDIFEREVDRTERGTLLRQALAASAQGLSLHERFILQRLEHALLGADAAAASELGFLLTVTVAEFAAHFHSRFDAARRYLRNASDAILGRVVDCDWPDGSWAMAAWVDQTEQGADEVSLRFTATFIKMFLAEVAPPVIGEARPNIFSSIVVSKSRKRSARPRGMFLEQVALRVKRRLKQVLPASETHHAFMIIEDSPWRNRDPRDRRYFQNDLRQIHQWVLDELHEQGILG